MTQTQTSQTLCPHLVAASLWMTKRTRVRRNGKPRVYYVRSLAGPAMDEFVAREIAANVRVISAAGIGIK